MQTLACWAVVCGDRFAMARRTQSSSEDESLSHLNWNPTGAKFDGMKTTVDIPEDQLEEAIRHTGAKTKREAVVIALADFNRRRRLEKLAEQLGTFEQVITPEQLLRLREIG